ncbi:hypothetical protein DY000_02032284 [Brassica cretica]|uniref:Aminotransferase-like plant mobile domain-containing protein n=1 Tax=Brassica cretica TaxID=69181 RepID=A0ABQ7DN81_BRACR|nr:hypothetical protein DY000_02032284 [Brassica cretica]
MLSYLYYFGPLFMRHSGRVSEGWFGDHDCTLACVGLHLQSAIGAAYTSRRLFLACTDGLSRHMGRHFVVGFLWSKLWFLLPRLLASYAQRRDVAISQMSPAAIRNIVVALVLGTEVSVDVDAEFFKAIYQMNMITDETFSVSIKTRCGRLVGRGPSKVDSWQRKYFFVRVSSSSVYDPSEVFRTEWNPQPGSFTCLLWNDLSVARVHRSIPRINVACREMNDSMLPSASESLERKRGDSPRKTGRVKRHIPEYSYVIKESASGFSLKCLKGNASSLPVPPPSSVVVLVADSVDVHVACPSMGEAGNKLNSTPMSNPPNLELLMALSPVVSPHDPGVLPVVKDIGEVGADEHAGSTNSKGGRWEDACFARGLCLPVNAARGTRLKGNLMIDQYDRACRRLSDELEAEHRVLEGEGEIVESFFLHRRTGLIDLKRSPMIKAR